jgi:hypothetical protein
MADAKKPFQKYVYSNVEILFVFVPHWMSIKEINLSFRDMHKNLLWKDETI